MTETATVSMTKKEAFSLWLDALRSDEYEQTTGALCRLKHPYQGVEGPKEHCCIGVLDEVVLNTRWYSIGVGSALVDEEGEEGNVSYDRVQFMDLDKSITEEEAELLVDYCDANTGDTRIAVLAAMNDNGADFDTIAMLLEDTLGWVEN